MWYRQEADFLTLTLYIQPGAKCTEISGLHGNALKIRLASPPIEGRANEALMDYVAELFHVPVRQVSLKRGAKSRQKVIVVRGSRVNPASIFCGV